jgi:chlorobactene glucosyltransferase
MLELGLMIILWAVALAWLGLLVWGPFKFGQGNTLGPDASGSGDTVAPPPRVSIIVAARNEEQRILRQSIQSMLAQQYPDFQVIAVDDRSTDGTLRILKELAHHHPRLCVIEGTEPPPGWLGKPNAMQQAFERAQGEWILATDADILFHPDALRAALEYAVQHDQDVVTLWPGADSQDFWGRTMLLAMLTAVTTFVRAAGDSNSNQPFTVGGFILMRRAALQGIGGYTSVRDELQDDVAMGFQFQQQGYSLSVLEAPKLVRARWYSGLRESWEGHQKHLFCTIGHSLSKTLGVLASFLLLMALPPVVVMVTLVLVLAGQSEGLLGLFIPAAIAYLAATSLHLKTLRQGVEMPRVYALLPFVGYLVFMLMLVSSIWTMRSGRGVRWKGRRIYLEKGSVL